VEWLIDQVALAGRGFIESVIIDWRRLGEHAWLALLLPAILLDAPRLLLAPPVLLLAGLLGVGRRAAARASAFVASRPTVSVIVAGYNERSAIDATIRTLLELDPPPTEIIIVDDNSEDGMFSRAKPYADAGRIRLIKNAAASGRGGKPAAVNLGLSFATGEFVVLIDADCSFDRDLLAHLIGPFADPRVGVVAANIKVRNARESYWTLMQAIEYQVGISVGKRWLELFGMNFIASGACGAYRRSALMRHGGCDPETAEDLDNSLKAVKAGWRVAFASRAIVLTDVPAKLRQLVRQRLRWDRDLVRVAYRKHKALTSLWRISPLVAMQLAVRWLATIGATYLYAGWVVWMLCTEPHLLLLTTLIGAVLTAALLCLPLAYAAATSERGRDDLVLIAAVPLFAFYSEAIFRWVRAYAHTLEYLRLNQEDPFLPQSAWRNAPRW